MISCQIVLRIQWLRDQIPLEPNQVLYSDGDKSEQKLYSLKVISN